MDIVYFGTDVFLSCFEYLSKHHTVRALYTYHNDEDYFTEYMIVRKAKELGIPVIYEAVTLEQTKEYFKTGVSLYFSAEYDKIIDIPEDVPGFRGVNIHSSALPQGRGYYPIESAMDRDLPRTGVTMHKLKQRFDSGDIIAQRTFDITADMDSVDVYLTSAANALEMTKEVFADLDRAWNSACAPGGCESYWKRPKDENLALSHDMCIKEALEVFRRYNGMTEAAINGKTYFVRSVMGGKAVLPKDVVWVSDSLVLYTVRDGHLRLNVKTNKKSGSSR